MLKRLLTSKKKQLKCLYWIFVTIGLLIFSLGSFYFSKGQVLNRYLLARQSDGNVLEAIKPYIVWADTKVYITMDEGRRANFPRLSAEEAESLRQTILSADEGDGLYLTAIGRKFWVFPDYRLAHAPINLTIKTNLKGADILLNDKVIATSDKDEFSLSLERLPMTDYKAGLEASHEGKQISLSQSYQGQEVIDLSVAFKTFSVTSNLLDGQLYFGEESVAQLVDGSHALENFPVAEETEVYVGKNFPDGQLTSKKISLSSIEEGAELDLSVEGLLTEEIAANKIILAFDALEQQLLNGQDKADLGDLFEAGSENDVYDLLKTSVKSKMLTDDRRASSLTIPSIYLTELVQTGKESYLVRFGARYDFYYDKATDPVKKSQGHLYQTVAGRLTLVKKGDDFLIANKADYGLDLEAEDNQILLPFIPKTVGGPPTNLVGDWELSRDDATYYMTISENGQVELTVVYQDRTRARERAKSQISSHKVITDGYYALEIDGSPLALVLGASVSQLGVTLSGDSLTTLNWLANEEGEIDYETYQEIDTWRKSSGLPKESSSSSSSSTSSTEDKRNEELTVQTELGEEPTPDSD